MSPATIKIICVVGGVLLVLFGLWLSWLVSSMQDEISDRKIKDDDS